MTTTRLIAEHFQQTRRKKNTDEAINEYERCTQRQGCASHSHCGHLVSKTTWVDQTLAIIAFVIVCA